MQGLIIGGGIGGLCTALALQRQGIDARVFEASSVLGPVGAGIWVAPNAMRVLDWLGVANAVQRHGAPVARAQLFDHRGRLVNTLTGRDLEARFGYTITAIHRSKLHDALLAPLGNGAVELGKRCVSVRDVADAVHVTFEDGTDATGDFLIGADGLHSVVRHQLFGDVALRYAGETCWRGMADVPLPKHLRDGSVECWGIGRRMGFAQVGAGQVYWWATQRTAPGGRDRPDGVKRALMNAYADFPAGFPAILQSTPEPAIVRHDLFDLPNLPRWSRGRVGLLGDAAHATTPNLGQGGAQAIESAWVLAECLSRGGTIDSALERYETRRRPKADKIMRASWRLGRLAGVTNPVARALRNRLVTLTPRFVAMRQLAWVFRPPQE